MNNTPRLLIIAITLFTLITFNHFLRADSSQSTAGSSSSPPAKSTPANSTNSALPPNAQTDVVPSPAAPPPPGGLTGDSLKQMLDNMGCDYKDLGNAHFLVSQSRDGWNLNVTICLSPDSSVLWLFTTFNPIADIDKVPSSVWRNLLLCNQSYGVTFALMQPTGGQPYLQLQHGIDNKNVTPQIVKKDLDLMYDSIISTGNWWDSTKWPKSDNPSTQPAH